MDVSWCRPQGLFAVYLNTDTSCPILPLFSIWPSKVPSPGPGCSCLCRWSTLYVLVWTDNIPPHGSNQPFFLGYNCSLIPSNKWAVIWQSSRCSFWYLTPLSIAHCPQPCLATLPASLLVALVCNSLIILGQTGTRDGFKGTRWFKGAREAWKRLGEIEKNVKHKQQWRAEVLVFLQLASNYKTILRYHVSE